MVAYCFSVVYYCVVVESIGSYFLCFGFHLGMCASSNFPCLTILLWLVNNVFVNLSACILIQFAG